MFTELWGIFKLFGETHVQWLYDYDDTVDGRNPANQLRLVVYPIIYRVLYIPGGAAFLPSTCSFWEPILDTPKLHQAVSRAEAVVEECGMAGEATQEEAIVATAGWAVGKWMGGKTCQNLLRPKIDDWNKSIMNMTEYVVIMVRVFFEP